MAGWNTTRDINQDGPSQPLSLAVPTLSPCTQPRGIWNFSSLIIEPMPPAVKVQTQPLDHKRSPPPAVINQMLNIYRGLAPQSNPMWTDSPGVSCLRTSARKLSKPARLLSQCHPSPCVYLKPQGQTSTRGPGLLGQGISESGQSKDWSRIPSSTLQACRLQTALLSPEEVYSKLHPLPSFLHPRTPDGSRMARTTWPQES